MIVAVPSKLAYSREIWEKIYFRLSDIMNTAQGAHSKNSPTAIFSFFLSVTSTSLHT